MPTKAFRWVRLLAPLALSLGLAVFLGTKLDWSGLRSALGQADWRWGLGAAAAFFVAMVLKAWRWAMMLRLRGLRSHVLAAFLNAFIGGFASFVTVGPASGDLVKAAVYARWYGYSVAEVAAAAYLDRWIGVIGWALSVAVALLVAWWLGLTHGVVLFDGFAGVAWVCGVGMVLALGAGLAWFFGRRYPNSGLGRFVKGLLEGGLQLFRTPRRTISLIVLSFLSHGLHTLSGALGFVAVGADAPVWGILWALPLVNFAASLPISAGGLGVRETVSMWTLGFYDVGDEVAVVGGALWSAWTALICLWGGWLWWRGQRSRRRARQWADVPDRLSVVIPTLEEEGELSATLERVGALPEVGEVIVIDGGSRDRTVEIARQWGAQVALCDRKGRGEQVAQGCALAQHAVVWILHADTWVASDAGRAALDCLRDPCVVWGGYWKRFREGHWLMAGSRFRCLQRALTARRVFGDQALFVRREALEPIGGHPRSALMEEFELQRALRDQGSMGLADAVVSTSARRFREQGIIRTYWRMGWVMWRYRMGAPPDELVNAYQRTRREREGD